MQCSNGHQVDESQKFCSECGEAVHRTPSGADTPEVIYVAYTSLSSSNAASGSPGANTVVTGIERTGAEKFWYVWQNIAFGSSYLVKVPVKKALSEAGLCVMTTAEKIWYVLMWLCFGGGYFHKVIIKKALNEAGLVRRTGAEQFWYVMLCISFGSGYFGKIPMKKALKEYRVVTLTDAEQFWYVLQNISFGAGYFAKVPIKKALSESSLDVSTARTAPVQKTSTVAKVLIPIAAILIVLGLVLAVVRAAKNQSIYQGNLSSIATTGSTGPSGATGNFGVTGTTGATPSVSNALVNLPCTLGSLGASQLTQICDSTPTSNFSVVNGVATFDMSVTSQVQAAISQFATSHGTSLNSEMPVNFSPAKCTVSPSTPYQLFTSITFTCTSVPTNFQTALSIIFSNGDDLVFQQVGLS